jgi:hypothetical protein
MRYIADIVWSVVTAAVLLGLYEGVRWLYYRLAWKVPPRRGRDEVFGWAAAVVLIGFLVQACPSLLDR